MPEFEAPTSGWVTLYIDGSRVCCVWASEGEPIEVDMETEDGE